MKLLFAVWRRAAAFRGVEVVVDDSGVDVELFWHEGHDCFVLDAVVTKCVDFFDAAGFLLGGEVDILQHYVSILKMRRKKFSKLHP